MYFRYANSIANWTLFTLLSALIVAQRYYYASDYTNRGGFNGKGRGATGADADRSGALAYLHLDDVDGGDGVSITPGKALLQTWSVTFTRAYSKANFEC